MICVIAAGLNYFAYYLIGQFINIIPNISPSNQTQISLDNQTVTQAQINQINFAMQQFPTLFALTVGVIAIIVTVYAIVVPLIFGTSSISEIAEEYFAKLRKGKPLNVRPYLKALINMKCEEFDLDLTIAYDLNPELFSQESLLRRLYKCG